MRISDLLARPGPHFSFEFFPPKTDQGEATLFETIRRISDLHPAFVSVTCGAGGSTRGKTVEWTSRIKRDLNLEAVAHLTCLGLQRQELLGTISEIEAAGIDNILALRGDPPANDPNFQPPPGSCQYASDLIALVRETYPGACVIGAAYPEGHVHAPSKEEDLRRLKEKVDAGLDVVITQLFFDNRHYFEFLERAGTAGIGVPIIPGIMPVTNVDQVERFTKMCGATIPDSLRVQLDRVKSDPQEVIATGVEHAVRQCRELLAHGTPGIHFYTLNRSPATRLILQGLGAG